MKTIGFIINVEKDINFNYSRKLIKYLLSKKHKVVVNKQFDKLCELDIFVCTEERFFEEVDFVIVLGGDGTILSVARQAAYAKIAILGINLGNLGYLTDTDKDNAITSIDNVLNGNFYIEKRMMLETVIDNNRYLALNEMVVNNKNVSRMIKIGVDINNKFVDKIRADGLIVSTPTGSTAYNLSAGGPILKPDIELMALTYISPHALFTRPSVISGDDKVDIDLSDNKVTDVILTIDGQKTIDLNTDKAVTIRKSELYTLLIKTGDLNFYDILREKMIDVRK